jgi:hypothetical protein
LVEGVKRVTKGIDSANWLYKIGKKIPLLNKQKLFLTRGHKYTGVFSFPSATLRTLHRRLLREGYSMPIEQFRKQTFVLEIKGMKIENEWIDFSSKEL